MATEQDIKNALASWASGVSVVTATSKGLMYGITVSSFSSVCLEPPMISVCLKSDSQVCPMIKDSHVFAVSILADDQQGVSNFFATPGRKPVEFIHEVPIVYGAGGMPVVGGAAATLVCAYQGALAAGDHEVTFGEIEIATSNPHRRPLLYFRRAYRELLDE